MKTTKIFLSLIFCLSLAVPAGYIKADDSAAQTASSTASTTTEITIGTDASSTSVTVNQQEESEGVESESKNDNEEAETDTGTSTEISTSTEEGVNEEASSTEDLNLSDYGNVAKFLINGHANLILIQIKQKINEKKEKEAEDKFAKILQTNGTASSTLKDVITQFITYGFNNDTEKLGEGERAAVVSSFKAAFNRLPETQNDLTDLIKIANGRFPSEHSASSEKRAEEIFTEIYRRAPDMSNQHDKAAIEIMAYGLRQTAGHRNLDSEKAGINIFKNIFKHLPTSTEDWNAMQAITYSGAQR